MYIFLDTNIFLHFKQFDQIDWRKIINSQEVIIVIAPIVIKELDKHKTNNNDKIATRAKKTLNLIENLLEIDKNKNHKKIDIEYINKSPLEITFINNALSANEQDDCLLSSILEYKNDHPESEVSLIAHDTGIRLKAKRLYIDIIKMPKEFLLPNEKSKIEKENEKLKIELKEFQNRIPKLKICFNNKEEFLKEKITYKNIDIKNEISKTMNKLTKEITKLNEESNKLELYGLNKLVASYINPPLTKQRIDEYNKKLEKYFVSYKTYLEEKYKYLNYKSLTIKIDLLLINEGTGPAENIDLSLYFPDGFEIMGMDEFNSEPKEPIKPYRPKNNFDYDQKLLNIDIPAIIFKDNKYKSNTTKPIIRKTNSYEIKYHIDNLKHFQSHIFDPLFLTFPSYNEIINFKFNYEISEKNIPIIIKNTLNVEVKKVLING
jgi:rRNA-processing protein FCF1